MTESTTELLLFLAHSLELEEEAMQRYQELATTMHSHNNLAVADFFLQMAQEAARHLQEVETLAGEQALPEIRPWEFDWPLEAPESTSYESIHYRMDVRTAMELALENERSARDFYQRAADDSPDQATRHLAQQFADEEGEHARRLETLIKETPPAANHYREDDDPPHMPE